MQYIHKIPFYMNLFMIYNKPRKAAPSHIAFRRLRGCAAANHPGDRRLTNLGAAMGEADYSSESKTEVCVNSDCTKICAKRRQTRYLPQEIVFELLLHVPAQVLHNVMRHVCREWDLMIRSQAFTYHRLRNSTPGIIIQKWCLDRNGIYVEMRGSCLEIRKFDCRFRGFSHVVWTSCNGLVLALDFMDLHILYVINPLTKQWAILPPYFHEISCLGRFCLVFVEASMEYKVVQPCCSRPSIPNPYIVVLTIGVDKVWRRIDIKHLSLASRVAFMFSPVVTGAYIHWIASTFVLTFDVETETIRWFPLPRIRNEFLKFLPMGCNLSVVSESIEFFRDVWEMNPKTGKWIKLLSFDLRPFSHKFLYSIVPFGWLAVREVLVFRTSSNERCCVAYNLKTRAIQSIDLETKARLYHFQAHVNSLIWL